MVDFGNLNLSDTDLPRGYCSARLPGPNVFRPPAEHVNLGYIRKQILSSDGELYHLKSTASTPDQPVTIPGVSLRSVTTEVEALLEQALNEETHGSFVSFETPSGDLRKALGLPGDLLEACSGWKFSNPFLQDARNPRLFLSLTESFEHFQRQGVGRQSIHILWTGSPRLWLIVAPRHSEILEAHISSAAESTAPGCSLFVNHDRVLVSPSQLREWNLSFSVVAQYPGELILIDYSVYHYAFNVGSNLTESIPWCDGGGRISPSYRNCTKDCDPSAPDANLPFHDPCLKGEREIHDTEHSSDARLRGIPNPATAAATAQETRFDSETGRPKHLRDELVSHPVSNPTPNRSPQLTVETDGFDVEMENEGAENTAKIRHHSVGPLFPGVDTPNQDPMNVSDSMQSGGSSSHGLLSLRSTSPENPFLANHWLPSWDQLSGLDGAEAHSGIQAEGEGTPPGSVNQLSSSVSIASTPALVPMEDDPGSQADGGNMPPGRSEQRSPTVITFSTPGPSAIPISKPTAVDTPTALDECPNLLNDNGEDGDESHATPRPAAEAHQVATMADIDRLIQLGIKYQKHIVWPLNAAPEKVEETLRCFKPFQGTSSWLSDECIYQVLACLTHDREDVFIYRGFDFVFANEKKDYFASIEGTKIVLIPIFQHNHWFLISVDVDTGMVTVHEDNRGDDTGRFLLNRAQMKFPDRSWTLRHHKVRAHIPPVGHARLSYAQSYEDSRGEECGVIALAEAENVLSGEQRWLGDFALLRKRYLSHLLRPVLQENTLVRLIADVQSMPQSPPVGCHQVQDKAMLSLVKSDAETIKSDNPKYVELLASAVGCEEVLADLEIISSMSTGFPEPISRMDMAMNLWTMRILNSILSWFQKDLRALFVAKRCAEIQRSIEGANKGRKRRKREGDGEGTHVKTQVYQQLEDEWGTADRTATLRTHLRNAKYRGEKILAVLEMCPPDRPLWMFFPGRRMLAPADPQRLVTPSMEAESSDPTVTRITNRR